MTQEKTVHAILLSVLAALTYTLMTATIKHVQNYYSFDVIIFIDFLVSTIILYFLVLCEKGTKFKTEKPSLHLLRGLAGYLTFFLLVVSLKYIPLVNGMLLNNTHPIFVPLIMVLVFKASFSKYHVLGIAVGFLGIILILQPSIESFFHLPSLIGLLSGLFSAVAIVVTRILSKTDSPTKIVFYFSLFSLIPSTIFVLDDLHELSLHAFLFCAPIGVFGALYQQTLSLALKRAQPSLVSPLLYTSLIFGILLDYFFFEKVPNFIVIVGILLVTTGSITVIRASLIKKANGAQN
jgi:drug/metabolite transporter (DMT)-like permease